MSDIFYTWQKQAAKSEQGGVIKEEYG